MSRTGAPANDTSPRVLERGDHVELATLLLAELGKYGEIFVHRSELWCRRSDGARQVTFHFQSRVVQSFAGAKIRGTSRVLRLRRSDVFAAIELAQHQAKRPHVARNRDLLCGTEIALEGDA